VVRKLILLPALHTTKQTLHIYFQNACLQFKFLTSFVWAFDRFDPSSKRPRKGPFLLGSFCGAFCGAKACGAQPRKMPRKNALQKKTVPGAPPNSKLGLPYSSQLLRGFLPCHVMIEIPYSDVIKDISFIIWPGQKPRSGEEYGSPSLDFGGAPGTIFSFCGVLLRGILRGWAPQALAPQKAPQNEPSWVLGSFVT